MKRKTLDWLEKIDALIETILVSILTLGYILFFVFVVLILPKYLKGLPWESQIILGVMIFLLLLVGLAVVMALDTKVVNRLKIVFRK
jgi:hypothetical protein